MAQALSTARRAPWEAVLTALCVLALERDPARAVRHVFGDARAYDGVMIPELRPRGDDGSCLALRIVDGRMKIMPVYNATVRTDRWFVGVI